MATSDELGLLGRSARVAAASSDLPRHTLRVGLWCSALAAVAFGAVVPARRIAEDFRGGHFLDADYYESVVLWALPLIGVAFTALVLRRLRVIRLPLWESAAAVAVTAAAVVGGDMYVDRAFFSTVRESVRRAQSVADAVLAFERTRGRPPTDLDDLVPEFLGTPDPANLLGFLPMLTYLPTSSANGPRAGSWQLGPCTLANPIRLEYAPQAARRVAVSDERGLGDWIVWTGGPWCW